jgi:hypothetical protein
MLLSPHMRRRRATTSSNHACARTSVHSHTLPPTPNRPFADQSKWRWWNCAARGGGGREERESAPRRLGWWVA